MDIHLSTQGCLPLMSKPTRVATPATLIDLIYKYNICKAPISGIILIYVANHFGICYYVKCKPTDSDNAAVKKRTFSDNNVKLSR